MLCHSGMRERPMKKGKDLIYEAFRDKKTSVVVGLLCLLYFILLFSSNLGPFAQILPPLPRNVFLVLAVLVLTGQAAVWRMLSLFQPRWFLNFFSLLLFFCEYTLSLFVITFLSWPVYLIGNYLYDQAHKVY